MTPLPLGMIGTRVVGRGIKEICSTVCYWQYQCSPVTTDNTLCAWLSCCAVKEGSRTTSEMGSLEREFACKLTVLHCEVVGL